MDKSCDVGGCGEEEKERYTEAEIDGHGSWTNYLRD